MALASRVDVLGLGVDTAGLVELTPLLEGSVTQCTLSVRRSV